MPQHLDALARANRVRLARAALKHDVGDGTVAIADVIADPPECAVTMAIADLLMSQHRWGRIRTRRLLTAVPMSESKQLGTMTDRQRRVLIDALAEDAEQVEVAA